MIFSKPVLLIHEVMFVRCEILVTSENAQLQAGIEQLLSFLFLRIACSPT